MRSEPSTSSDAARGWKAMSTRMPVTSTFQVKIGIRNMVMPGARMVITVVMKLTEPRMVPKPCRPSPRTHKLPPAPGVNVVLLNGAYAVQPNDAAPCGVRNPEMATRLPKRYIQNAKAFSRGNATSGAPICNGMMTLAKPANSGVANISSINVPCMVNSWLYCSFVSTICIPGSKSSRRMMSAITPPTQKKKNEPMRYMYPIVLWSVDVIQSTMILPLLRGTTGASRAA